MGHGSKADSKSPGLKRPAIHCGVTITVQRETEVLELDQIIERVARGKPRGEPLGEHKLG